VNDAPLSIDGTPVTQGNARRFVRARVPTAEAVRETWGGWHRGSHVRVSSKSGPSWCHATAKTAKEAWLKVARQMVEHDAREAARSAAMAQATQALMRADSDGERASAALRYAAERLDQGDRLFGDELRRVVAALREMADEPDPRGSP
jgi:hypothetical protein